MATIEKRLIWSNYPEDISETFYEETIKENLEEGEETTEEALYSYIDECLTDNLDIEREELDIELDEEIITFAKLGLWNGVHFGYRERHETNLKDILSEDGDYVRWYVDRYGELSCDVSHHDGNNHYFYRKWKVGTSDEMKAKVLDAVYYVSPNAMRLIKRYTVRLGDLVGDIYGWTFPNRPKETQVVSK